MFLVTTRTMMSEAVTSEAVQVYYIQSLKELMIVSSSGSQEFISYAKYNRISLLFCVYRLAISSSLTPFILVIITITIQSFVHDSLTSTRGRLH